MHTWSELAMFAGVALVVILCLFAAVIFWLILVNRISLDDLLEEANGKASLSRFQLLLFTFVIAGLYLLLSIESGTLIDIPTNVLGLLGLSSGSYLISKGVQSGVDKAAVTANTPVPKLAISPSPTPPAQPPQPPPQQ